MAGYFSLQAKLAAVDDDAADRRPVPAQELGGRVEHDVGPVLDRPAEVGRGHGVVDHQRHAGFVGDGRHAGDIQHVHARVGDGLAVDRAGLRSDGSAEVLGVVRFHELGFDAEAAEADVELRVGAAVERAGGHDLFALPHQAAESQELRRLSAGGGQGGHAAFERRHALLEDVGGGIHDAGVNVAELLEREEFGGVGGVVEDEGGALVDGHGARVGGLVGGVAGVQGTGGEAHLAGGSIVFSHNL